jgi:hypothetical protein
MVLGRRQRCQGRLARSVAQVSNYSKVVKREQVGRTHLVIIAANDSLRVGRAATYSEAG